MGSPGSPGPGLNPPASWQTIEEPHAPARPGSRFRVHVDPVGDSALAFALSVATGLDDRPRRLDPRYLYDTEGARLFEEITHTPEYYQTRTEEELLARHAPEIRALVGDVTLAELGSGASTKTRQLLDAWTAAPRAAGPVRYVPIDVCLASVTGAAAELEARYPDLAIEGIAASYERALPLVRSLSPLALAFLGSSIGNLGRRAEETLLALIAGSLAPGDFFLVGLDLAHDPAVLEAAYNDAAGWTAAFTRNLFARMNRELGAAIPLDAVEHVAHYDAGREWIDIGARFHAEVRFEIPILGRVFRIAHGERIATELSRKYRVHTAAAAIERHGFRLAWHACDERRRFALLLFRRRPAAPAPARSTVRARRLALLGAVRQRTLDIVEPVPEEDLLRQPSPLMSPVVWDLGHIAEFEELWLGGGGARGARRARGEDPADAGERRLDALYDPQLTARADRHRLPLPSVPEARAHLDRTRAVVRRSARLADADAASLVHMVAQHEAWHQETILQALNLDGLLARAQGRTPLRYRPAFVDDSPPVVTPLPCESLLVPGGPFVMGTDDRAWAYDNERPAHLVDVPAFRIDAAPVTNGAYADFIADGGYRRRELWSAAGWQWLEAEAERPGAPLGWRRDGDRWLGAAFGCEALLDARCPVAHVSWYEADAFARWAGKRLPTEAEWEKAAAWDPASGSARRLPWDDGAASASAPRSAPGRANLDQRRLAPAPVGAFPDGRSVYGCHQMLGDVWEWTASWFEPYPGFATHPYREYSEIFFGATYRALRGGSFATAATVARTTVRNWDFPQRRQIFAGFRCAENVQDDV